jgi:hypothetical protein
VELAAFLTLLQGLDAAELRSIARAIEAAHQTAADEVAAWEDLMKVDEALRVRGRSRVAARAAHEAVQAVRRAVDGSAVVVSDSVTTRVAREAALLARAIVAGVDDAVAHLEVEFREGARVR